MLISAQDLVKKSADLYRNNFKLFFKLALLVSLPSIITAGVIAILTAAFVRDSQEFFVITLYGLFFIVITIISYVIVIWFSIVKVRVIAARYENKDIASIGSYIHSDKKLILPVIGASILSGLAIFGGFILFIIPGIIFSIWFVFVMYSVVLDNQDSTSALGYSKSLVKGRWWATLWRIVVPTAIFLVGTYLLQTPFAIILNVNNSIFVVAIATIATYLINILFTPFIVASQVILYSNLKSLRGTVANDVPTDTKLEEPPF